MPDINLKSLHILVVDDQSATTISVAFVLRNCGYTVDAVPDGTNALTRLKEKPGVYHILITDHAMLNLSGLELLQHLQEVDFRGKIVVLSAHLSRELRETYEELGAHRFVAKPFDLGELRQTVAELGTEILS